MRLHRNYLWPAIAVVAVVGLVLAFATTGVFGGALHGGMNHGYHGWMMGYHNNGYCTPGNYAHHMGFFGHMHMPWR